MIFRKILIAVDESAFAKRATEIAVELASSLNAEIAFIHVYQPSVAPGTMWGEPADRLMEMSERAARQLLTTFRDRAAGSLHVSEFLETGKPALKIVEVAKKWPADLIVMGSHGRGKAQSLVVGSVAHDVLHRAPCPVLIVRAET
ncbi:MAG TPA: universal stress protein [Candidatus Acidoferrum sp.]|jgi:nucleotide-binding universal stress UspA family protein|nr:universal stress protein [Candidatus Acidoferrum sp.]